MSVKKSSPLIQSIHMAHATEYYVGQKAFGNTLPSLHTYPIYAYAMLQPYQGIFDSQVILLHAVVSAPLVCIIYL